MEYKLPAAAFAFTAMYEVKRQAVHLPLHVVVKQIKETEKGNQINCFCPWNKN